MTFITPGSSNYIAPVDTTPDTYSHNILPEDEVMVYPVPTGGPLFVRFNEELSGMNIPVEVYVYSVTGWVISVTRQHSSELIRLSLENQPEGLYFVRVTTGERVFVKKVVLF